MGNLTDKPELPKLPEISFQMELSNLFNNIDLLNILVEYYISDILFGYSNKCLYFIDVNNDRINKYEFEHTIMRFANNLIIYEHNDNIMLLNLRTLHKTTLVNFANTKFDLKVNIFINDRYIVLISITQIFIYNLCGTFIKFIEIDSSGRSFKLCGPIIVIAQTDEMVVTYDIISDTYIDFSGKITYVHDNLIMIIDGPVIKIYDVISKKFIKNIIHKRNILHYSYGLKYLIFKDSYVFEDDGYIHFIDTNKTEFVNENLHIFRGAFVMKNNDKYIITNMNTGKQIIIFDMILSISQNYLGYISFYKGDNDYVTLINQNTLERYDYHNFNVTGYSDFVIENALITYAKNKTRIIQNGKAILIDGTIIFNR